MSLFPRNEVFSSVDVRGTSAGAKELVPESSQTQLSFPGA